MRVLIIGCGYLGRRAADRWLERGVTVTALTRSTNRAAEWTALGLSAVVGDVLMPGTLELLILKTLERHRDPLHGYGIARYIQRVSDDVLQVEEGSLYPALQRLAVKGWVEAEWGISDNKRRARLYRLTRAGRKQLAEEVADFERLLEAILRVVRPA